MKPLLAIIALLVTTFGLAGPKRRRKVSARKTSVRKSSPKRREHRKNSAGKYVDGRGKPYTPANAPNWLRAIWAQRKRQRRKK
jgi:hypothetical protein